jgi:ATP-binding cassette subfamily C exporter for protease/lipase
MSSLKKPSELHQAMMSLRPYFVPAAWFSLCSCLLLLAPSGYMLEVYDRVVNNRNHMTLVMLTVLVLGAYVLMEILEWARSEVMHEAGLKLDKLLRNRIFTAIFEANLKRVPGGSLQPLNDFQTVRDF